MLIIGIIGAFAIVVLCLCCAGMLVGAELYAGQILTATASAPTPTPVATDTPVPTFTPLPTATPIPTATPTPDPLGHLSPEEKNYVSAFEIQAQRWTESRQRFDTLMANPNPSDANWKDQITTELSTWKGLANEARSLAVPGKFQAAHERYLSAVQNFDTAADLAREGIDNQDVVAFDQAREDIRSGDVALSEAKQQVETLKRPG